MYLVLFNPREVEAVDIEVPVMEELTVAVLQLRAAPEGGAERRGGGGAGGGGGVGGGAGEAGTQPEPEG